MSDSSLWNGKKTFTGFKKLWTKLEGLTEKIDFLEAKSFCIKLMNGIWCSSLCFSVTNERIHYKMFKKIYIYLLLDLVGFDTGKGKKWKFDIFGKCAYSLSCRIRWEDWCHSHVRVESVFSSNSWQESEYPMSLFFLNNRVVKWTEAKRFEWFSTSLRLSRFPPSSFTLDPLTPPLWSVHQSCLTLFTWQNLQSQQHVVSRSAGTSSHLHPTTYTGVYMWMLFIRALRFFYFNYYHLFTFVKCLYKGFLFNPKHPSNDWLYVNSFPKRFFFNVLSPVANLIILLQNRKTPNSFCWVKLKNYNWRSSITFYEQLWSDWWKIYGVWQKDKNFWSKNVKTIVIWVIYGPVLLCTILIFIVFFICVALYRLLHNKSYLPDL